MTTQPRKRFLECPLAKPNPDEREARCDGCHKGCVNELADKETRLVVLIDDLRPLGKIERVESLIARMGASCARAGASCARAGAALAGV